MTASSSKSRRRAVRTRPTKTWWHLVGALCLLHCTAESFPLCGVQRPAIFLFAETQQSIPKAPYKLGLQPVVPVLPRRNATRFFPSELPLFLEDARVPRYNISARVDMAANDNTNNTNHDHNNTTLRNDTDYRYTTTTTTTTPLLNRSLQASVLPKMVARGYEWPDPNRVLSSLNIMNLKDVPLSSTNGDGRGGVWDDLFGFFVNATTQNETNYGALSFLKEQDVESALQAVNAFLWFEKKNESMALPGRLDLERPILEAMGEFVKFANESKIIRSDEKARETLQSLAMMVWGEQQQEAKSKNDTTESVTIQSNIAPFVWPTPDTDRLSDAEKYPTDRELRSFVLRSPQGLRIERLPSKRSPGDLILRPRADVTLVPSNKRQKVTDAAAIVPNKSPADALPYGISAPPPALSDSTPISPEDDAKQKYVTAEEVQKMLADLLAEKQKQTPLEQLPQTALNSTTRDELSPSRRTIRSFTRKSLEQGEAASTKGGVAFPQPSQMTTLDLKRGNAVAAVVVGMTLGTSIMPNLWLVGGIGGGLYGYNIDETKAQNVVARFISYLGRRVASACLQLYDYANTMFFMYKTGQLSYNYYKRYAKLDEKFAIQAKIDAWNARFAEGKVKFDTWEKENEVGRRVLAGLRTLWLVEEQSFKKTKKLVVLGPKSRYRFVRVLYKSVFFARRAIQAIVQALAGDGNGELNEFLRGVARWKAGQSRAWAALWSCAAVSLVGTVFSLSPLLLSLVAILVGVIWPSWPGDFADAVRDVWEERRALGRDQESSSRITPTFQSSKKKQGSRRKVDKSRYHFYKDRNGKKKYYRVGQDYFHSIPPLWKWGTKSPPKKRKWGIFFASSDKD